MSVPNSPKISQSKSYKFKWSVWFPYPSSWFRALILIPIIFPGAHLIILGSTVTVVAVLTSNLIILMIGMAFGILIPTIILSFFYHSIWFVWKTKNLSNRYPKWIPRSNSLWEAFYASIVLGITSLVLLAVILKIGYAICSLSYMTSAVTSARCSGRFAGRVVRAMFYITDNALYIDESGVVTKEYEVFTVKYWFLFWLPIAAYLYQVEYLIKQRFIPWLKRKILNLKYKLSSSRNK